MWDQEFSFSNFGFWIFGFGFRAPCQAPYAGCYGGRKVYRFFTDLTEIFGHPIKFFGFDWVRLGSIPAWFQKMVTSLFAFLIFDFGLKGQALGARRQVRKARRPPSPLPQGEGEKYDA